MLYKNRSRRGFTLLELLVVISIIILLVGLSAAALQAVRITQAVKNTSNTVAKLQAAVDIQVKAINELVSKMSKDRTPEFQTMVNYCDGDADRAAALITYCRVKQAFPVTNADLAGFSFNTPLGPLSVVSYPAPPAYSSLAGLNNSNPDLVAAALLYAGVSQRAIAGNAFDSDAATGSAQIDLSVGLATPTRGYRDAFGTPITYTRFFNNAELDLSPYANLKPGVPSIDPFDPTGKLAGNWTNKATAQNTLGVTFNNSNLHNKVVLVYAGGKDYNRSASPLSAINLNAPGTILGYRLRLAGQKGTQ